MAAWNPEVRNELEQSLVDLAGRALEHAADQGASSAEVSIGQGQGFSATVRKQDVETIEHNRDKNLGITVYFGHRSGNVSTTDFSDKALAESVAAACNIARYTEEDPFNGLADESLLATEFPDLDLYHPWNIAMDDAIDLAARCEKVALDSDPAISNTEGATVSSHDGTDVYANSHGFIGLSRGSRHSLSCSVVAGEGANMQRDYWYDSCRDSADMQSAESIGAECSRRTLRRIGARKMKTGEYPVVFEPQISGSLLSHLVSAISGGSLYRKASFLLDQLEHQIFPEFVNIYERPFLQKAAGSAAYDAEGVKTRENDFVRNGVLRSYLLGSYAARKLELQTTANAGGVHNLIIDPTIDGGLDEIVAGLDRGVVVSELIGFGVNTVTGDYSRGAFGFWVENGEIMYPVQEFTIAGNLREMFQNIEAVGSDFNPRKNTRAGSIKISRLTIAGE